MKIPKIHIGDAIQKHLDKTGIHKASLARKINTTPQSVGQMLKKESLNTQLLQSISEALNYNFFKLFLENDSKEKLSNSKVKFLIELDLENDDIKKMDIKDKILEYFE